MLSRRLLISPFARHIVAVRPLHDNFKWPPEIKFKWEKNPKGPKMAGTHQRPSDPEDPEVYQYDAPYKLYPEKGDKPFPSDFYREPKPQQWEFYLDRLAGKFMVGVFWFWVFYNLYWNYQQLTASFFRDCNLEAKKPDKYNLRDAIIFNLYL